MISKETYDAVMENEDRLNSAVIYDRDFTYVGDVRYRMVIATPAQKFEIWLAELFWVQDA